MFDEATTLNSCDLPAPAELQANDDDVDSMRSKACALCKKAGVKKPATRLVPRGDRLIPMCTWHWNVSKQQIPDSKVSVPQLTTVSDQLHAITKGEEVMARPKYKCKFDGCAVPTASKVGYCAKHFHLSRGKNPNQARRACSHAGCEATLRSDNQIGFCKKHRLEGAVAGTSRTAAKPAGRQKKAPPSLPRKLVRSNSAAQPGAAVATLCLTESAIDQLWRGLSLEKKAQLLEAGIAVLA